MDLNVIRRITTEARTVGVDQATASLRALAGAQEGVGVSSDRATRANLSVERSYEGLQRRLDAHHRATRDFERDVQVLAQAQAQGLIPTQQRLNELMALATQRYQQATQAKTAFGHAMAQVQAQAASFVGSAGVLGSVLAGLGRGGFALAAGIGLGAVGLAKFAHGVNDLADRAGKLVDLSETVSLTTDQLQGLVKAGGQVGVESEKVGKSVERFTISFEEARQGSGDLYNAIRDVDKALADQLTRARDNAEGWDIVSEAYRRAEGNQRNLIARATFGQRNLGAGRLFGETAEAGGIDALTDKYRHLGIIGGETAKSLDQLKDRVDSLRQSAADKLSLLGAEQELQVAADWHEWLNRLADDLERLKRGDWRFGDMLRADAELIGGVPLRQPQQDSGAQRAYMPSAEQWSGSAESQNALAASADKVVQSILPEIEATQRLEQSIRVLTEAADANVNARMRNSSAAAMALEALLNEQAGLQNLQMSYQGLGTAVAQRVQALEFQAQQALAVTVAEREQVAIMQLQIQLGQQRLTTTQQLAIVEATRAAQAAQREGAILQAGQQALQNLQLRIAQQQMENSLIGQSAAVVARTRAEWEALLPIRQALIAAGKGEEEINAILDEQKEKLAALISQMASLTEEESKRKAAAKAASDEAEEGSNRAARAAERQGRAANEAARSAAAGYKDAAQAFADWIAYYEVAKFVPSGTYELGKSIFKNKWGQYTQFNPEGYKSTMEPVLTSGGPFVPGGVNSGGYTYGPVPGGVGSGWLINQQGYQLAVDDILKRGGNIQGAISQILAKQPQGGFGADQAGIIQRLTRLLPEAEQAGVIESTIAELKRTPVSLAREELISQLNEQLKQLQASTEDLIGQQGELLSGLYARQFGQGFYDGGASAEDLIYGLDNATGPKFDALRTVTEEQARRGFDQAETHHARLIETLANSSIYVGDRIAGEIKTLTAALARPAATSSSGATAPPGGTQPRITIHQENIINVPQYEDRFLETGSQIGERTVAALQYLGARA